MLEQKLTICPQQHWVSKLLGFDFLVDYYTGSLNTVADALSRRDEAELVLCALSALLVMWFDEVRGEIQDNTKLTALREQIIAGQVDSRWSVHDGLILYKDRVYLLPMSPLISAMILGVHRGTHEGVLKTLNHVKANFYWKGMLRSIQDFIQACTTCQQNKSNNLHLVGLLQPLAIPKQIWSDISMDFIEGLLCSHRKSVILVVVDRFSKAAHFLALAHPFTATSVAQIFL